MGAWFGTGGLSCKERRGSFHTENLPDGEMPSYYGGKLNELEIEGSFHRMPATKSTEERIARVAEDFPFGPWT